VGYYQSPSFVGLHGYDCGYDHDSGAGGGIGNCRSQLTLPLAAVILHV